ncbi:sensor domain-containing diguanylate cyclase [Lentibacillus songyuanensis]|uniref:sensor domain-containing diguanylate cyclase n=1 Tax=Lentibacillus songyuanensis TaxID=3136161 RepID=UPI0031BBAFB4
MTKKDTFHEEKLKSICFEIITMMTDCSEDELLFLLVEKLQQNLDTKVTVFVEHAWTNSYKQVGNQSLPIRKQQLFDHGDLAIRTNTIVRMKNMGKVCQIPSDLQFVIVPIVPKSKPAAFIGISISGKAEIKQWPSFLKIQLERLFSILNQQRKTDDTNRKNKFLYDLMSRCYSLTDKKDILVEITKSLDVIYPDFTYHLLLSQDYEMDHALPVKTIAYSDDATKWASTQAFITGEVQLENRIKEKNTCLYAPLKGDQGVYGVLQIIAPEAVDFPGEEIDFMIQFAVISGKAIENATLYAHSKGLVTDLKMINDATHQLNTNLKIPEITSIVKQYIIDSCHATEVGFFYFMKAEMRDMDILPGSTKFFYTEDSLAFIESVQNRLKQAKEAIFSGDFKTAHPFPFRSVMVIPMLHSGEIHGMVAMLQKDEYFFSFDSFKLMQSLIQHSTLAMVNAILKEQLEKAVITDYLTKLYSRNHLDDQIQLYMATAEQGTLILFDIDDFKQINDTYGHSVGDEVIKQVAEVIKANLNDNDIPARWGGEELAIYLPGLTIEDGVCLATRIRKQVQHLTAPRITLSCGVSTWTEQTSDSVKELFIRADKALYEAKSGGKNRVVKETKRAKKNRINEINKSYGF